MDPDLIQLLRALLVADPNKRLGSAPEGAAEVRAQKAFAKTDWAILAGRKKSPFVLRIDRDDSEPKLEFKPGPEVSPDHDPFLDMAQ